MQGFLAWNVCLGRIAGVQVRLHLLFLMLPLVFLAALRRGPEAAWWAGLLMMVLAASILVHELAHCRAARRRGGSPHEVVLWPLGGLVQVSAPRSPGNEIAVALAGPIANGLLALAAFVLYSRYQPVDDCGFSASWSAIFLPPAETGLLTWPSVIHAAAWINLGLACLNLLPAAPLDGGRAARGLLWGLLGYRRALPWTKTLSLATAAAVVASPVVLRAVGMELLLGAELLVVALGIFLFLSAHSEPTRARRRDGEEPREADEWRLFAPEMAIASDEEVLGGAIIGQTVEARLEEKLHREHHREEEEDRRVDEILSRLHAAGPAALSAEDQALLNRASARYRGRKSK